MLIGKTPDQPLMLQRIEPVDRGLIGEDIAAKLDFSDKGGAPVFGEVPLDELVHRSLFLSKGELSQTCLQQLET